MKMFNLKIFSLTLVLGSSLGFSASALADEGDSSESSCIDNLLDPADVAALEKCIKEQIDAADPDDAEVEAIEKECEDEYDDADFTMEEIINCIKEANPKG